MTNPVIKTAFPSKMINLATRITLPTDIFHITLLRWMCGAALLPVSPLSVVLCFASRCSFPPLASLCLRDAAFFSVDSIYVISFTTLLKVKFIAASSICLVDSLLMPLTSRSRRQSLRLVPNSQCVERFFNIAMYCAAGSCLCWSR